MQGNKVFLRLEEIGYYLKSTQYSMYKVTDFERWGTAFPKQGWETQYSFHLTMLSLSLPLLRKF